MNKIDYKKISIVVIILAVTIIMFRNTMINQTWYSTGDIKRQNSVFISGDSSVNQGYVKPEVVKRGIYNLPRVSYHITTSGDVNGYNAFLIEGLKPLTEYRLNVSFNATLSDESVKSIDVGAINYPPENVYDEANHLYKTNITTTVTGDYRFNNLMTIDGFNSYHTEVKFKTNENGQAWLILGFNGIDNQPLDFNIGQLKIQTTEIQYANTITQE